MVSDSLGRFRVVVKKTRPNLGIAIEGGADTKQKLPRVINIAANGAAFEAGGLRVGQLILAVDGQKLDGQYLSLLLGYYPPSPISLSLYVYGERVRQMDIYIDS